MSPVSSPARASSPAPEKNSSPVKDIPAPEQDTSAPDVHMDTGDQQDAPDTSVNASSAGTADNASASSKSTNIDKGKAPEVPEIQAKTAQTAPGQATSAAPEKTTPQTSASEKTPAPQTSAPAPAKTGTPITSLAPTPAKAAPTFKMTRACYEYPRNKTHRNRPKFGTWVHDGMKKDIRPRSTIHSRSSIFASTSEF
jgi:putative peptide zinc metalloprotease protein